MRPLAAALVALALGCARRPARPVTIFLTDDVLCLDPNRQVESVTDSVLTNVFEPLVALDSRLQIRTALAERWENPEPERWRFHLRPNVRFHDGTPLTAPVARDALLALQRDPSAEASGFLREVVRIEAVDDATLDLVTREPRALLPSLVSVYITKGNDAGAFPPFVGTGPYRLTGWTPGRRITLARWDGWWGALPATTNATFVPVRDAKERLARLARGEGEIAYAEAPELAAEAMPAGVRLVRGTGLTVFYLGFNLRGAPGNALADPRVRRAFHLALDRRTIVARAIRGLGASATQPVSPLVFGFNPRIPLPSPDVAEARRLMKEAGHASDLEVRFDYPATRAATARLVAESLGGIGVRVDPNPLARSAVYALAAAGKSDFFFVGWDCTTGEAGEFYDFNLHSRVGGYGAGNYGGYANGRLDELTDATERARDPNRRKELLEQAAAIVMDDLPILPLYVEDNVFAVREGTSFHAPADGEIRLAELGAAEAGR